MEDRAAEQARVPLHLRNHATSIPWRRSGAAWRERTKTARSRRSNDHQLRLPIQPGVPDHLLLRVRGLLPSSRPNLRPSKALNSPRSMSLTHIRGHSCSCFPTELRGRTFPREPFFPIPLPLHTLRDGGQTCRVGGHIGRCAK